MLANFGIGKPTNRARGDQIRGVLARSSSAAPLQTQSGSAPRPDDATAARRARTQRRRPPAPPAGAPSHHGGEGLRRPAPRRAGRRRRPASVCACRGSRSALRTRALRLMATAAAGPRRDITGRPAATRSRLPERAAMISGRRLIAGLTFGGRAYRRRLLFACRHPDATRRAVSLGQARSPGTAYLRALPLRAPSRVAAGRDLCFCAAVCAARPGLELTVAAAALRTGLRHRHRTEEDLPRGTVAAFGSAAAGICVGECCR